MLRALTPLLAAALFFAAPGVFAQQKNEGGQEGHGHRGKHARFDCSKAKDPKACEERREKARASMKKAHAACDAKQGSERRACMRKEMCAQSQDPAKCEARAKEGMERRAKAMEACKDKQGDERKACMREQRGKMKSEKK